MTKKNIFTFILFLLSVRPLCVYGAFHYPVDAFEVADFNYCEGLGKNDGVCLDRKQDNIFYIRRNSGFPIAPATGGAGRDFYDLPTEKLKAAVKDTVAQKGYERAHSYAKITARITDYETKEKKARAEGVDKNIVRVSRGFYDQSKEEFKKEKFEEGMIFLDAAHTILDFALDMTPGVSWAKDCCEAVTGQNLVDGRTLTTTERSISLVGALTLGLGSKVGKGLKAISKYIKKPFMKLTEKLFKAASNHKILLRRADIRRVRNNPLKGTRYTEDLIKRMRNRVDLHHSFPKEIDNFSGLGKARMIRGGDGLMHKHIHLKGEYAGKKGQFEWIIDPFKEINHRYFNHIN